MKIAFFLDNEKHRGIDYSRPMEGNPGIGGTQYMIWTVSYYLSQFYDDLNIYLMAPITENLPENMNCIKAMDEIEALNECKKLNIDIFVFRGPKNNKKLFDYIDRHEIKSIMWTHNFEDYKSIEMANNCKYLTRNVCVGTEQYDRLRDHSIFKKSKVIFNALDFTLYDGFEKSNKNHDICYVGNMAKGKGFHCLAKIWPEIVKRVPDARLNIIGGANLYDVDATLGKYKIAQPDYEKKFMKYLIDKNGEIFDNVNFMGVMGGKEKLELMSNAKVGIANPSGEGETFCIVAVEFQALGVPVVSIEKNGLINTVKNKETGLLFHNEKEFIENVVELLLDDQMNKEMSKNGSEYVRNTFALKDICSKWDQLFYDVMHEIEEEPNYICKDKYNNQKWLRELNRKLQADKIFKFLPSIIFYEYLLRNIWSKRLLINKTKK